MSATQPTNLDLACAETGRALAALGEDPKQIENTLTKALGVLQEQGVYALFLFLSAREKRRGVAKLARLLEQNGCVSGLSEHNHGDEFFKILDILTGDLDTLLFARELLERALVYGRYHAKARGGSEGGE